MNNEYKTSDISIRRPPIVFREPSPEERNTAILSFKGKRFECVGFTCFEEKTLPSGQHQYIKTDSLIKIQKSLDQLLEEKRTCKSYRPAGYFIFQYNVLGVFNEFLNSLEDDSSFVSDRNGDEVVELLNKSMNTTKQIAYNKYCTDQIKKELVQRIEDTCKKKNITLKLDRWYAEIVSKEIVSKKSYLKIMPWDRNDRVVTETIYAIKYADGFVKTKYEEREGGQLNE